MMRVGLELNATMAWGVSGPSGEYPPTLVLDPPAHELPLAIHLEKSTPEVGMAGRREAREKPHFVCDDFLPFLGATGPKAPKWHVGRHKLDAEAAFALVLARLAAHCKGAGDVVVALPSYINVPQATIVHRLAQKAKLKLSATLSSPLAAALASYAEQAWVSSAVILDIDDHALSLAHVVATEGLAQIRDIRSLPTLGLKAWKSRLLNSLADVCVWQTRRDPRDTPKAEQHLYDHLDELMDATLQAKVQQIGVQGNQWYQNLLVSPEQTVHFCGNLLKSLQVEIERFLNGLRGEEATPTFVLTHAAGRLPGLLPMLRKMQESQPRRPVPALKVKPKTALEDFGESLMAVSGQGHASTVVLTPDALARGAHGLDAQQGTHSDEEAMLPLPLPVDAGPARLAFQGLNYYLSKASFNLGAGAACQLAFDAQRHPDVAGKHCEILFEQRAFVLTNRSRSGTMVNESLVQHSIVLQPGDWIRLGNQGPMLRFLGATPWRGPKATA